VLANAAHVIGGSSYLVDYAKRFNQNVSYVPTVVDSTIYNKTKHFTDNPTFTIGWIGSPSTAVYLNLIVPALKSISATQNVRIVLIGAGNFSMQGISFEAKEWSEQDEIAMMLEFDVGIMPLSNDEWSKGKCGFKLIQYMACGLPVIASPVGVNTNIVTHGENGFLANAINDWEQALVTLINNKALCQKMGQKGRVIFEKHYSLAVNAPKLINIISTVKDNRLC
jgi:glycosyltransferase involved in cell wall biosynthesis